MAAAYAKSSSPKLDVASKAGVFGLKVFELADLMIDDIPLVDEAVEWLFGFF